jgi:threonine aldolase
MMDFRSDTVTKPSEEMRRAMAAAEVGDDIFGDDPTSNALSEYAAGLTGTEAAIYTCSGTMGNLIAFLTAGSHGRSVLAGTRSHVWINEVGGLSSLAGLCPYPIDDAEGIPQPQDIENACLTASDIHHAPTSMLVLENTHNMAGGLAVSPEKFAAAARKGRSLGLHVHLDGARIFNASVFYGVSVKEYVRETDSLQFCLSKGLGAPLGSMLCGTKEFIERAKRWRKCVGGAQRQLGVAAAAALYALRHNIERLAEDHENCRELERLLREYGVATERAPNMTNMVYFKLPEGVSDDDFVEECAKRGLLLCMDSPRRVRVVTHLDVGSDDVKRAAAIIAECAKI